MSAIDIVNFTDDGQFTPIAPQLDPIAIWNQLFGSLTPNALDEGKWDKSILDYVDRRYTRLAQRIGSADKQRIEEHLSRVRELEKNLARISAARCAPPGLIDTTGYDPYAGSKHSKDVYVTDPVTDAMIPSVGKFMIDMLVMALACDHTAVATLMWSDCQAMHTFPWLGLNQTYAFYQGDGGFKVRECQQIGAWYVQQHSHLLQQMAAVELGFHSLLDESVVYFGSEIASPPTHRKKNMPYLLAGGGGGLRGGRWLQYHSSFTHSDLLVSIANRCGDPRTEFGDPRFCKGALANL